MKLRNFLFVLLLVFPLLIEAHPAKKVKLKYAEGKLFIEAMHPVNNAENHYISNITVYVDGVEVKTIEPKRQSSKESEIVELLIPEIQQGSKVVVKTSCNKLGNKKAKIVVR